MPLIAYNLTGTPVTLAAGTPAPVVPISAAPPARGPGLNVTSELRGLSGPDYAALEVQRPATVEYAWSGDAEYATAGLTVLGSAGAGVPGAGSVGNAQLAANAVNSAKIADGTVALADLASNSVNSAKIVDGSVAGADVAVSDAAGLGPELSLRKAFAAGAGGAPDDVAIYTADAPFKFRILDSDVLIATTVLGETVQLRSSAGGGGAADARSDAFSATTAGRLRDTGAGTSNATRTIEAGGSLSIRRSDSGIAGEFLLRVVKET